MTKQAKPAATFVSVGGTTLNLGLTGNSLKGYKIGTYNLIVGDSDTGKTLLALTILAEAANNPAFDGYRFIYDSPEIGSQMDIATTFGQKAEDRIEFVKPSVTLEEFYDRTDDDIKSPCIKILDSHDSVTCAADIEQVTKEREARETNKKAGGSYGTGKASVNSERLRTICPALEESGSILIIICQTRDNIGFGSQFNPKVRSGGHALTFYAATQIWLSLKEQLKGRAKGKEIPIGGLTKARIKRSRFTGKRRDIEFCIYSSTGIDDIGTCVKYLVEWGHWKETKKVINATEFGESMKEEQLCQHIDKTKNGYALLRKTVVKVWREIEKQLEIKRTKRYE